MRKNPENNRKNRPKPRKGTVLIVVPEVDPVAVTFVARPKSAANPKTPKIPMRKNTSWIIMAASTRDLADDASPSSVIETGRPE